MCEIKIALSKLSEKNFSRKWPSLWAKPIDTLKNWVVKLPCRRSMIPGSRMQLWTFLADRTYQRDIKPVPTLSCGGVFWYRSGERLHGMQEVSGSIPLFSTKKALYFVWSTVLFFLLHPKTGPKSAGGWMAPPFCRCLNAAANFWCCVVFKNACFNPDCFVGGRITPPQCKEWDRSWTRCWSDKWQTAAILNPAILFWKRKPAVWNDTAGFERK